MRMDVPVQPTWHRRVLAVLMTAPALVAALSIVALEVWRSDRPDSELFVTPFAYTLAEAIERDDVRRAYAFIRAGQDPNELIAVRHPVLTAGQGALVSPLLWSVATNSGNSMRMLLGHGARMERRADRAAACLADALGHDDVARLLRQYGPAPDACPKSAGTAVPLVSFLSATNDDHSQFRISGGGRPARGQQ